MQILLSLMSGVALLVWGTHMTRKAMLHAFGARLRGVLAAGTAHPARGFLAGLGVTALIQSSSATALMTSAFVADGLVTLSAALPIVLGADVGSSLMALVLSVDVSWLSPLLLLLGIGLHLWGKNRPVAQFGKIIIGLGQITLALQLIRQYAAPLVHAGVVRAVFAALGDDMLLALAIGAMVTVAAYSSLAVVLLTATLTAGGVITPATALPLVLGANLGSGLLACFVNAGARRAAKRVSLANLLFRLTGVLMVLPWLGNDRVPGWLTSLAGTIAATPGTVPIVFHAVFNLAVALAFIWAVRPLAALCQRLLPDAEPTAEGDGGPRYLNPIDLQQPVLAMGNASREVIRIGEMVEQMLSGIRRAIVANDRAACSHCRTLDDRIDALYASVKLYLTEVDQGSLRQEELQRWHEIMLMNIHLEYAGDIGDRILADLGQRKIGRNLGFSAEGQAELLELCDLLSANLRTSLAAFLSRDAHAARLLDSCAAHFVELERRHSARHIARIAQRRAVSVETSGLHLDLLHDMAQMNALLCHAVADSARHRHDGADPRLPGALQPA
ncbi:Na/Pi cotransporter family protein [Imbroritus primus]|uniref:Na/Pi cotransporter family protein n=1 Tax=Imbroritus primus TaxID=3058603 RepID=A0ACD3SUB5_9BURK|nr:Na/Pi cotransporter family protein [Burkholderiaceae bacterium PBA]